MEETTAFEDFASDMRLVGRGREDWAYVDVTSKADDLEEPDQKDVTVEASPGAPDWKRTKVRALRDTLRSMQKGESKVLKRLKAQSTKAQQGKARRQEELPTMEIADQETPVEDLPEEGISDPADVPIPDEDESLTAKRRWLLDDVPMTIKKTRLVEVPHGGGEVVTADGVLDRDRRKERSDGRLVAGKR